MTAEDLKKSILQQAIQGKLVPQNPDDEPASALLERIRTEKARLVAEGKIKRDKNESVIYRNPDGLYIERIGKTDTDISDQIPFEIPESWEWVRMGKIGDWGAGATPAKAEPKYYGGDILWLRTGELNNATVYDTEIKITDKALKECSLRLNQIGDILIAMYGATIGKLAIVGTPLTTNQACCACTPILVYNLYLFYFLMASKTEFIKKGEGGAQPNISREKLINYLMPLPPLAEQERIVAKIEELMPMVEEYGKVKSRLDELNSSLDNNIRKSVLQYAIEGKLVPQNPDEEPASALLDRIRAEKTRLVSEGKIKREKNESVIYRNPDGLYIERIGKTEIDITKEIPFEIPDSWEWVRLGKLIRIIGGTSYKKSDVSNEGVRILRGGNIQDNCLVLNENDVWLPLQYKDSDKNIYKGDVIIVASTGSTQAIGKPALITNQYDNIQIGAFLRILRPHFDWFSNFFNYILISDYYRGHIRNKVKGTNINNIKAEYIEKLLIPLPPLAEQKRIVDRIEEIMSLYK